MRTLALDADWDLVVKNGNLVVLDGPAAIAQDVASAVRLFRGELWYDSTPGIPYFETILGQAPPRGFLTATLVGAAMTVPEVARVRCSLNPLGIDRRLTGTLRITTQVGEIVSVTIPDYVYAIEHGGPTSGSFFQTSGSNVFKVSGDTPDGAFRTHK